MKLTRPPNQPTERQLLIGMEGTGKTYDTLKWLDSMAEGVCYYMDSDDTIPRFLASDEFSHLSDRIVREDARFHDWDAYKGVLKRWEKEAKDQDLIVIDRAGEPWDLAQEHVMMKLFNMSMEEWALEAKSASKEGNRKKVEEFYKDNIWQFIKPQYKVFSRFCQRTRANLVLIAAERPLTYLDDGNPETQKMWASVGAKPEGEKHLGNLVHTVIRKTKVVKGKATEFRMSTSKDRQRELVSGVVVNDFAVDYLLTVAGWEIAE